MDQNTHAQSGSSQLSGDLAASLDALQLVSEHKAAACDPPAPPQKPPAPPYFPSHPLLEELEATRRLWQQQHGLPAIGSNGVHFAGNFQHAPPPQEPPAPPDFPAHLMLEKLEATSLWLWQQQHHGMPAFGSNGAHFPGNFQQAPPPSPLSPWVPGTSTSPYPNCGALFAAPDAQQRLDDSQRLLLLQYRREAAQPRGFLPSNRNTYVHVGLPSDGDWCSKPRHYGEAGPTEFDMESLRDVPREEVRARAHADPVSPRLAMAQEGSEYLVALPSGDDWRRKHRHFGEASPMTFDTESLRDMSREEVRARALAGPVSPRLVMAEEVSQHLVGLLDEGDEWVRTNILAGVLDAVHKVVDSKFGHAVFVKLLMAPGPGPGELADILFSALGRKGSLLRAAKQDHGAIALKALITAVSPYPELCKPLLASLVAGGLMRHSRGLDLVTHCFSTLRDSEYSLLIRSAVEGFDELLQKAVGCRCLSECFSHATGEELRQLVLKAWDSATEISEGEYGNWFMQAVLQCRDPTVAAGTVARIMANVVRTSMTQFGSYTVEACILKTSRKLRGHVLRTFQRLTGAELSAVVQSTYGNFVIQSLLRTVMEDHPKAVIGLARRIQGLPELDVKNVHARQVLNTIRKLLSRVK